MNRALFVYGTLLWPEVFAAVTGRQPTLEPATLPDYARHALHGEVFPAIVATAGAHTHGALCAPLEPALLQRLDDYEGVLYRRTAVTAINAKGRGIAAWAYVLAPGAQHRLGGNWDAATFARRHLAEYLRELQN